jgi:putative glutamine amidotransferase
VSRVPLIGVSTSEMRLAARNHPLRESDPTRRELALGLAYPEAVQRAGAVPVVLPPATPDHAGDILDRLSGLCLSGGPDLDPACYGGPEHPMLGPREPDLDRFELALVRGATARGMPVLAICRGAQVLNVARGGTLIQHLPEITDGSVEHRQDLPSFTPTHAAELTEGSLVAGVLGATRVEVNSFHHQAVDRLGDDLRIVGRCPDGVVEAIEGDGPGWTVGVQWHAEGMIDSPEQARLFAAFIEAAAKYEDAGTRTRTRRKAA